MGLFSKLFSSTPEMKPSVFDKIKKLITESEQKLEFTPDFADLQTKNHRLFVYDRRMAGYDQHNLIAGAKWRATAFTYFKYQMLKYDLGKDSYPIPYELPKEDPAKWGMIVDGMAARIRGELYEVDADLLAELDSQYQNGVQFLRKRSKILIPHTKRVKVNKRSAIMNPYQDGYESAKIIITTPREVAEYTAWIYVAIPKFWDDKPRNIFKKMTPFEPNFKELGPYYCYTKMENDV